MRKSRNDHAPALPETPPAQVWIEDTKTAAHGHGGPGWEFGSCLWSPSSAEGGTDRYAIMRELNADDFVIHFNDGDIVGWSRVAAPFQEVKEAPPNPGEWAGRPSYYRIPLRDYRNFRDRHRLRSSFYEITLHYWKSSRPKLPKDIRLFCTTAPCAARRAHT